MILDFFRQGADAEAQAVPEQKASATGRVVAWGGAGRVAWSPRDVVSLARTGFAGNPVGFRCVKRIAEAVGAGGVPVELHVLRSDRMSVVPGTDGWPVGYEYAVAGRKHRFDVSDGAPCICHIKSFHPQDDHYGLSPLQAAAQAVDVHNAASRWSKALLDNAARPSGAIVYKGAEGQGALGADQYDRLVSEMEAHHQGARNAGRPMLLEGGLDWKPMGFSPSDMEFQKTKESAAREIALAFGVPPMLLGIPGDATFANYQEANRAFYRLTVLPLATRVR